MSPSDPNSPEKKSRLPAAIVAAGAALGLTLAGLGIAAAQTDSATNDSTPAATSDSGAGSAASAAGQADAADDRPAMADETELTGDTAEKVKAAALAAVPGGTIIRVETDADGSPYEAHVRKADGSEVVVKVDESFAVTSVDDFGGPGGPGGHHRGHGPRPGDDDADQSSDAATTTS